ncbi:MAG: LPS translocon maturation chaperone LptM [Pseudohongiellaceae bacterium]
MKKETLILLTACLICACGQKGPLVPPETAPPETTATEMAFQGLIHLG